MRATDLHDTDQSASPRAIRDIPSDPGIEQSSALPTAPLPGHRLSGWIFSAISADSAVKKYSRTDHDSIGESINYPQAPGNMFHVEHDLGMGRAWPRIRTDRKPV
jgi:hypothetical protein